MDASATQPTAEEEQKIADACDQRAPFFLVPQSGGPVRFQCGRLSLFGCAGIRQRCATEAITDAEKVRCRDFLGTLNDRGICP